MWKESIEKFKIIKKNYNYICNDNYANYKIINLNFKSYYKNKPGWVLTNMKNIYIHIYYFFYYYYNDFIKFIDDNSYENYNKIIKYFLAMYETLMDVWFAQKILFYLKPSFLKDFLKDKTLFFEKRGFYLKKKLILKVSKIIKAYLWSINIDIITSVFNKIADKIAIFNKEDKMKNFLKWFILLLFSEECVYYDEKYIEFKKSTINLMAAIIKDDNVKRITTKSGGKKTNKEKYKILVNM